MDSGQLSTTLFDLASTCAQVWSGLLVFYVLLLRDQSKENRETYRRLWSYAGTHLANVYPNLASALNRKSEAFASYGFNSRNIESVTQLPDDFEAVFFGLIHHDVLTKHSEDLGLETAAAKDLHAKMQRPKEALERLRSYKSRSEPTAGFTWGMAAILLNIIAISAEPYLSAELRTLNLLVLALAIANIGIGFGFYYNVLKILKWAREEAI